MVINIFRYIFRYVCIGKFFLNFILDWKAYLFFLVNLFKDVITSFMKFFEI